MKRILAPIVLLLSFNLQAADSRDSLIARQQVEIEQLKQSIVAMQKSLADLNTQATTIESNVANLGKTKSALSGAVSVDGNTVIDAGGGWHRSHGSTGWYNQTFGGGWYMSDPTWIRTYGSKNVYTDAVIRADGGFQVSGKTVIDSNGKVTPDAVSGAISVPIAWKAGNNGTVSCDTFCWGTQWAGWRGVCVGAVNYAFTQSFACSAVAKQDVKCLCGI